MPKRRKRKLILEKKQTSPYTGYAYYNINNSDSYRLTQGTLFNSFEPYKANRFVVFLQNE